MVGAAGVCSCCDLSALGLAVGLGWPERGAPAVDVAMDSGAVTEDDVPSGAMVEAVSGRELEADGTLKTSGAELPTTAPGRGANSVVAPEGLLLVTTKLVLTTVAPSGGFSLGSTGKAVWKFPSGSKVNGADTVHTCSVRPPVSWITT